MKIKLEDIKIGDLLLCKRTSSHNLIDCHSINRDMEFCGRVEEIKPNGLIVLDNPASVRIDKVVRIGGSV